MACPPSGVNQAITVTAEKDPGKLPWGENEVDVVLESTGVFRSREAVQKHLDAGARKVLISAPGKDALDGDFVIGVNEEHYDPERHHVISIGSCTTNCLAPLAKVLNEEFTIQHGLINTIHAYTNDQSLLDSPHKDPRRARSAADNTIPTSTGAATAIGAIMPELDGVLAGLAIRVPVKCGSLLDLTCQVADATSADAVNDAMRRWSETRMRGVLRVEHAPIVSTDVIGTEDSAILSARDTYVSGDRLVKVLAWYDNEWAFSRRCTDMINRML